MSDGSALAALIEEQASEIEGIQRSASERGVEYRIRGRTFAVVERGVLEVELGAAVAAAAVRTPDTESSRRGPEWVTFRPSVLDQFARDRAVAWFEAAHRRAAGRPVVS